MQIRRARLIRTPSLSDLFRSGSYGVDAKGRGAHRGARVSATGGEVAHWRWSSVMIQGSSEMMERTMVIDAVRGTQVHGRDARKLPRASRTRVWRCFGWRRLRPEKDASSWSPWSQMEKTGRHARRRGIYWLRQNRARTAAVLSTNRLQ
jgi:hypothetical protein